MYCVFSSRKTKFVDLFQCFLFDVNEFVRYKRSLFLILSAGNAISKRLEGPKFPLGGGGGGGLQRTPPDPPDLKTHSPLINTNEDFNNDNIFNPAIFVSSITDNITCVAKDSRKLIMILRLS